MSFFSIHKRFIVKLYLYGEIRGSIFKSVCYEISLKQQFISSNRKEIPPRGGLYICDWSLYPWLASLSVIGLSICDWPLYLRFASLSKICLSICNWPLYLWLASLSGKKRYFRIDQHLARHFVNYSAGLSSPTPFLCSQTITPFYKSMLSTYQERRLEF